MDLFDELKDISYILKVVMRDNKNNQSKGEKMSYWKKINNAKSSVKFCRDNVVELKAATPFKLRKIMKENGFSEAEFISTLEAFGIHALDPETQNEHNRIFGHISATGEHLYSH